MTDTATRSTQLEQINSPSGLNVTAMSPDNIRKILLNDGWHEVSNCSYTQFAVGQSFSPPSPNKLYGALSFTDKQSGSSIIVPVSQILAYETK